MERKELNSLNEAALQVQLNEGAKDAVKSGAKTVWETLPLRGEVERKLKGTKLGKYTKKKLSGTRSLYDINAGLPAGGAEREIADVMGEKPEKKIQKDHVEYNEINPMVLEYFSNYFGDNLNEDTSDEDIMEAVYDLIDLTDVVLSSVGLLDEEATWAETHGENQRKNRIARSVNSLSPVKTFHNKAKKSKREFDRLEKTRTAGTQVVTTADGPIKRIKNADGSGPGETIIKGSWRGREGNPYSGGNPRPAPKPETFRGRPVTFSSKPKPKLAKKILQQGTPGKPGYIKLTPKNN